MKSYRLRVARAVAAVVVLTTAVATACTAPPVAPRAQETTVFGSNVWQAPGESRPAALARVDATYGPIGIARIFSPSLPGPWDEIEAELGDLPVVVSFKLDPDQVLSGAADTELRDWFESAPVDRDVYWAYFHEPENDVERGAFTPAQFTEAWSRVARLARSTDNARLHATVILMCYTVNQGSERDWRDYAPSGDLVDVLAWDCYAKGTDADSYADPATLLDPARKAAKALGADWAIGELGARIADGADGQDRANWLNKVGTYATRHRARFVTYFDAPFGGSFQLLDGPSIQAWAGLVGSSLGAAGRPVPGSQARALG